MKSKNSFAGKRDLLPPFLNNIEPLEPEDLPLQVALLTMEIRVLRQLIAGMAHDLEVAGRRLRPPRMPTELADYDG